MNEAEAEQFVKDMTHAMCCLAHRSCDTSCYSDDMGEKVVAIREQVTEEIENG